MLAESPLQRQSYCGATPFARVCSQCAAELDTQHPFSSDLCAGCSMRFKGSYLGGRMKANGDNDKDDRTHPPKTPSLYIPQTFKKGMSFPAKKNMQSLNSLPPFSTSDDTQLDATQIDTLDELKYPDDPPAVDPATALPQSSSTSEPSLEHSRLIYPNLPPAVPSQAPRQELGFGSSYRSSVRGTEPQTPLWTTQPLRSSPHVLHNIGMCSTKGCVGLIVPSSTCLRCVKCIKAEWKIWRSRLSAPKISLSSPVSILRTDPPGKGKRKSVSWADQQNNRSRSLGDSPDSWISKIKRVHLKLPEPPLPSSDDDMLVDGRSANIKRVHLKATHTDGPSTPVSDDSPDELNSFPCSPTILQYNDLVDSPVGDNDLNELTDTSSEESDSESDRSSSGSTSSPQHCDSEPKDTGTPSKLVIRIPARNLFTSASSSQSSFQQVLSPSPTASPYARCADVNCHRYLPPSRLEHLCTWCSLRQKRRDERKLMFRDQSSICQRVDSENTLETVELPATMDLISHELLSGDVVPDARLCTPCQHIIPPHSEYSFRNCCFCRIKARLKRMREAKLRRQDTASDSDDEVTAMIEENTMSEPPAGRCQNLDCGVVVHGFLECWQCASRRLRNRRQRGKTRGELRNSVSGRSPGNLPKGTCEAPSCTGMGVQRPLNLFTPYPEYRCQHELLADFHMKMLGFLQVQNVHSLYIPRDALEMTAFGFDGQFSVVALDFDLLRRREAVEVTVSRLKGELQRLGSLHFDANKILTINESGIFTRYMCLHRRYNPFGPPYPDQKPTIMQGELEIAVLPDRSHNFIPGQKTIVRFRLVG